MQSYYSKQFPCHSNNLLHVRVSLHQYLARARGCDDSSLLLAHVHTREGLGGSVQLTAGLRR